VNKVINLIITVYTFDAHVGIAYA